MDSLIELIRVVGICVLDSGKVFAVGAIVFYIYSVIGMKTFGRLESFTTGEFDRADFSTVFTSSKTLVQVMCGSGYSDMLTQMKYDELVALQAQNGGRLSQSDLDSMGTTELVGLLYFGSFTIMSMFIILNLFVVNVLDTFDCETRIQDRSVSVSDQWGFSFCWAGLTLTTAACPSLKVEHAKAFLDVVKQTSQKEAILETKKELTLLVSDIPSGWLGENPVPGTNEAVTSTLKLQRIFSQYGDLQTVTMKTQTQAWVVYEEIEDDEMKNVLEKPVVIRSTRHSKSRFNGHALKVTRSESRYRTRGVQVKLPGESPDATGILTVTVERVRGCPPEVLPIVLLKKVDKHLNHGGQHVEKSTRTGFREKRSDTLLVKNPMDGQATGGDDKWSDTDSADVVWTEGQTLEYQINEHSKEFYFHIYDSLTFESSRWTASAHVPLSEVQSIGKSGPGNHVISLAQKAAGVSRQDWKNKPEMFKSPPVELEVTIKYRPGAEGVPNWQFLQQFNPDNERFKREDCESSGLDGWLYVKKSSGHFFKRTWMCITVPPRRLVMVRDCDNETEFNELGRKGKLKIHIVSIPATELGRIISGHGKSSLTFQEERDFRLTQIRNENYSHLKLDHGLLCIGDIRGRGLPFIPASAEAYVSIQFGSHFHAESDPVDAYEYSVGAKQARVSSPRTGQHSARDDEAEAQFTQPHELFIVEGNRKKQIQITLFMNSGTEAGDTCIGYVEVDVREMQERAERHKEMWLPIQKPPEVGEKKKKKKAPLKQVQDSNSDLGEIYVRVTFAAKEDAAIQLSKWMVSLSAKTDVGATHRFRLLP